MYELWSAILSIGEGCPVYNLIPEWNDLVYNEKWEEAFADF